MEKHNEFHTDVSQNGTQFRLTFITNDKNNFLAMQDLARKFVDGEDFLSLENRVLVLEHDKAMRNARSKIEALFANMQYGKICSDPVRIAYYKSKLNEIFGSGMYQDTDAVKQDGYKAEITLIDDLPEGNSEDNCAEGENK